MPCRTVFLKDPETRPALVLVARECLPIHFELEECPPGEAEAVADILADAVLASEDGVGRLPTRVEARYPEVVARLDERLDAHDIEVSQEDDLPDLDALAIGFMKFLQRSPDGIGTSRLCFSTPQTWAGWRLADATVAGLFEAAAAFYRAEPWLEINTSAPLEIATPSGRRWVARIIGGRGGKGLSLFSDRRDRERLASTDPPSDEAGFRGTCLSLVFEGVDIVPAAMRREVMEAGWTVAGTEAYPIFTTINTPGGGVVEADMRDFTAALRVLASGASALGEASEARTDGEWEDPGTGAVAHLDGARPWEPEHTSWTGDPALDRTTGDRLSDITSLVDRSRHDHGFPRELTDRADTLLTKYATGAPEEFAVGGEPEVLAAAALHAAGMLGTQEGGRGPTVEDLADIWNVPGVSIWKRSAEIRQRAERPVAFGRLQHSIQAHFDEEIEALRSGGLDPETMVKTAGFRVRPGPFDVDWLADATDLAASEKRGLVQALEGALDRQGSGTPEDADTTSLAARLDDITAFGGALRSVLRDDGVPIAARHALARWVLSRLADLRPLERHAPESSLLALNVLAEAGDLRGEALGVAVMVALSVSLGADEGLAVDDVRPLLLALARDPDLPVAKRAEVLREVVEQTTWGMDPEEGPALIRLVAEEEGIAPEVRRDTLELISGWAGEGYDRLSVTDATRQLALRLRVEMLDPREVAWSSLLKPREKDAVPGLVAAECLESYASEFPLGRVRHLVRLGLQSPHESVREAMWPLGWRVLDSEEDHAVMALIRALGPPTDGPETAERPDASPDPTDPEPTTPS